MVGITRSKVISFFSCRNDVLIFLFWFHCRSIKFSLFSRKRAKPRERPQKGLKPVWNHSETPAAHHLQRSLSPLPLPLSVFLSLSLLFVSHLCLVLSSFPDRCMSFRTAMSTIRVRFGSLLFRTAACLSGPQCLQLECVLGACFSGPLHVFPDRNVYSYRVRFGCLLFRTAACLSGPQCLQLEYVLGACFSGPLHVFPDRNVYSYRVRFGCLLFRTAACLSGPQCLQLECVLGACFSGPLHVRPACVQTSPMLDPSWAQVGPKIENRFDAS